MALPSPPRQTSPSTPDGRSDVLDIVYRSLITALTAEFARTYDADVLLRRVDDRTHPGRATLLVECRALGDLRVRLRVRPVDGNTYEIWCKIEDGTTRRFSFSRPDEFGVRLSVAPVLGMQIADYLLDAAKSKIGDRVLRGPAGPPSRSSHPSLN